MFSFLLDAANIRQVPYDTVSDKLAVGGEVTLRGMGTVFAVLILIWFLVELLHLLLGDKTKAPKKEVSVETVTPAESAPVKAEPVAETVSAPTVPDYELIAVITAPTPAPSVLFH